MAKRGRPKENRVTMNITVQPVTRRTIRASIVKGDRAKDTAGKIVDEAFKP
jgi:hypothetical protein